MDILKFFVQGTQASQMIEDLMGCIQDGWEIDAILGFMIAKYESSDKELAIIKEVINIERKRKRSIGGFFNDEV